MEFAEAKERLKSSWAVDRDDFARVKEQLKKKNAEHHVQNGRLSQSLKVSCLAIIMFRRSNACYLCSTVACTAMSSVPILSCTRMTRDRGTLEVPQLEYWGDFNTIARWFPITVRVRC